MRLSRTGIALGTLAFVLTLAGCSNAGTHRERATAGTGNGSRESAANRAEDVKSAYEEPRVNRAGQAMVGDAQHPQTGVVEPGQGAATTGPVGRGGTGQPQPQPLGPPGAGAGQQQPQAGGGAKQAQPQAGSQPGRR